MCSPFVRLSVIWRTDLEVPPNTLRAYTSDWNQFEGWCDARSLEPLPARPEAVATYLASLAMAGKADSTIGRHLAAIGWKHRQDGLVAPVQRDDRMVVPRPASPPRLPAVHPLAVLVIDAGLADGGLVGQHARQRAEKRVRGEDTPCPEAGRGKVDRSACERRRGAARHDAVAQAGSSALSRR